MAIERRQVQWCPFDFVAVVDVTAAVEHQFNTVQMAADRSPTYSI